MSEQPLPQIAQEIVELIEGFRFEEARARIEAPRDGGALGAPLAGLLRGRALAGVERWGAAYRAFDDVRRARDLGPDARVEAQLRTARVLRFASPLVDAALEMALAAARNGARMGGAARGHAADACVEAALLFARKRCPKLAARELDRAAAIGGSEGACGARVACGRADVAIAFDARVEAREHLDAALALAGDDAHAARLARLGLARLLTLAGEFERAHEHLGALAPAPGDTSFFRTRARLHASQGRFVEAAADWAAVLAAAPEGDGARWSALERAACLWRGGAHDEARAAWTRIAGGPDKDDAGHRAARLLERTARADARAVRLTAFPSVAQLRDHCGPASVELCLRFFGTTADQVAVAREIKHPDGGTPIHRMRWYMDRAGFVTRRIEADLPRLKAILDAGVPVILEEDYSTTRHVAVAIGYDDRRELLEIQDPMSHEIRETLYEELPKLREFSNHGALVAVPAGRSDLLAKLDAAGAVECEYMTLTDKAWRAKDEGRAAEGDALCDRAVAVHEAYELAWVYRFVRARAEHDEKKTEATHAALVGTLDRILALWPDDEWPQQFLGRVCDAEDRHEDALAAFERARDRDPDDANNWCAIGDALWQLERRGDARKAFEECLTRDPSHTRANENLADFAFDQGDVGLARVVNECALELGPSNPFNHHVRAKVLAKDGDLAGAAEAYARASELAPGNAMYPVERAKLVARAGRVDEAMAAFAASHAARPEDKYVLVTWADVAYEHGALAACAEACAAIRALEGDNLSARAIGGAARMKAGELDLGLADLREVLARRPTYAWVQREIARHLSAAGRHADAITAAAANAGVAPGPQSNLVLAEALARGGFGSEAGRYVRRAASQGPMDRADLDRAAAILHEAEGAGSAHALFQQIAEERPEDADARRAHLGLLLERVWAPGAAAAVLSKLSELAPEDAFVLAKEGDELMDASLEEEPRGEALLRRAMADSPRLAYPRRLLGKRLNALGRHAEALAALEPCSPTAGVTEERVRALVGLGKEREAHAALEAAGSPPAVAYVLAEARADWAAALPLAEALSKDAGELDDDGQLSWWERRRFECLVACGRGEEALAFGEKQCADAEDRGDLAYLALTHGDLAVARALGDRALALDPDEPSALHVAARLADLAGDAAAAAERWHHMERVTAWHVHVENLGRLALAEGDLAKARTLLDRAVATGHVCPVALGLRAEARLLAGDRAGARGDADRAKGCVQLPWRATSEHLDALLAATAGRTDEARALWQRYVAREKLAPSDKARFARLVEAT